MVPFGCISLCWSHPCWTRNLREGYFNPLRCLISKSTMVFWLTVMDSGHFIFLENYRIVGRDLLVIADKTKPFVLIPESNVKELILSSLLWKQHSWKPPWCIRVWEIENQLMETTLNFGFNLKNQYIGFLYD